jgi:hypothetical protein
MIDRLLESHLEPIARDHRRSLLLYRLARCWLAAALVGLALILLRRSAGWASSWTMPGLGLATLAATGWLWWSHRRTPIDYGSLARRIEQQHPELHALLLTAVEQQPLAPMGQLNYLQRRVIDEALECHRRQPWDEGVMHRLFAAWWAQGFALIFLLIVLAALRPGPAPRNSLPAMRSNGVLVTPGDTALERGSGLVVLARFDGKLPTEATLVVKAVNAAERRLPLAKNLDDPVFGGGLTDVQDDLTYRVEFPGGRTREFKVTVFEYPRLVRADAVVTYPSYTGLAEKRLPDTRRVSAVEGSGVAYAFHLNKRVATARLVAKDQSALPLSAPTNHAAIYQARLTLDRSLRYELVLVDEAGRTNKIPPEFVLEALKNQPPELRITFPRGDQRVSPLEEIGFQAEASDDFGLRGYGLAFTLTGKETTVIALGKDSRPHEKRAFGYLLPLENVGAQPDQLISYYLWADDIGPDGQLRRTTSDIFFAEVRPFDEIFREAQSPEGGAGQGAGENQGNSPTQQLAELQKQVLTATWNLKRRETAAKPSAPFKKDTEVVLQSQQQALEQAQAQREEADDPRAQGILTSVEAEMAKAAGQLSNAVTGNLVAPLTPALAAEQAAYQALLRLQAREYQIARSRGQRGGRGGGGQRAQQQIDQLDLRQAENRYETQRQAAPNQNPEQREQLQVLNRLKELAQRQQDLNERLKELQTALQEARNEQEREELRRRLKRLRDEQQALVADADELRQRMERQENQSRMADAREQLDQARSLLQRASEALDQNSVPQALSSGTRAERELEQLRDEFRRRSSGQFAEDMRRLRNDARQMTQNEEAIARKLDELGNANQKRLGDSDERRQVASQLTQQKGALTNLFTVMRQVSEQAEATEPLLSQQLYDLVRQNNQEDISKALDGSAELLRRGFVQQAAPFEQRARQGIEGIQRGVERAAEAVLGDETEALRLAKRELDDLGRQLDSELAANEPAPAAAAPAPEGSTRAAQQAEPGQQAGEQSQPGGQGSRDQARDRPTAAAGAQPGNGREQPQPGAQNRGGGGADDARSAARRMLAGETGRTDGGSEGGSARAAGPLTGSGFIDWSDRLRDVEEMLDEPGLRGEVARVRDRARVVRTEYRRHGEKPDWAVVRLQIAAPLAEVRSRVAEELARRQSKDGLVPLDRDPVPPRFSELVRRYYERLGKSD